MPTTTNPAREPAPELATLEVERAFLGAILCLHTAEHGAALLTDLHPHDLAGGTTAATLELARTLVFDQGQPPAPVLVYTLAEQRLAAHQLDGYGEWLLDTYRGAPPPATGWHLRALLLEHAWRRTLRDYAETLLTNLDRAEPGELAELDTRARTPVEQAAARYRAARHTTDPDRSRYLEAA